MSCKHKRVVYHEMTPRTKPHLFHDGKLIESSDADYGAISPIVFVECLDCGLEKHFNLESKSCPKWVRMLSDALLEV